MTNKNENKEENQNKEKVSNMYIKVLSGIFIGTILAILFFNMKSPSAEEINEIENLFNTNYIENQEVDKISEIVTDSDTIDSQRNLAVDKDQDSIVDRQEKHDYEVNYIITSQNTEEKMFATNIKINDKYGECFNFFDLESKQEKKLCKPEYTWEYFGEGEEPKIEFQQ